VVEEVLQLVLGEGPLHRGLFVVLDVGGGVPFEEHLSGVGAESLFADPVPPVVGIADIGAEHPQRVLVTPCRRLLSPLQRAQIAEELLHHGRRPRPREFVGVIDEALDEARSRRNRVSIQVAAQLLVAPPLEHFVDRLGLRMEHRNRADDVHATTQIDGQDGPPDGLIQ
jgi:hypothetical protein